MSDDEFMQDSDAEDFNQFDSDSGSEKSDGSESDGEVDIENEFEKALQYMEDDPEEALVLFEKVVELEQPPGEWGFKAVRQTITLCMKMQNYEKMLTGYKSLLTYGKSAVSQNESEEAITEIIELVGGHKKVELLQQIFDLTMLNLSESREDITNDRMWFKLNVKLGKMYLDVEDYEHLLKILTELEAACKNIDGTDDVNKATQLFEVLALKVPMLTALKNTKELKREYLRALTMTEAAVPHPLIMGIIRECGGKMYLANEQWEKAYQDFFEAFKSYDEAGSTRRLYSLKMMVLANMLMKSTVDPFDAQESKPYRNNPQIKAMTDLVNAYQAHDIKEFEKVLKIHRTDLMNDPFIRDYISDLLKNVRTEVLIKVIKPYTRVRIPFLSKKLNIDGGEVEHLLRMCILDGTISAKIDQVAQILVVTPADAVDMRYDAMGKWASQLNILLTAIDQKLS
eukprot:m.128115 g.128115  ORF g.128115 m.128115 type:complete len:455 (+) comp29315_c1_seq1:339-1703(+)